LSPVGLLSVVGEDENSHDSTLPHRVIKLRLCYCFE